MGFSFYSLLLASAGLFVAPLSQEFGWSRTLLSAGPSAAAIVTALLSPAIGALIDRLGSRRIALPGLLITIAAVSGFGLATGSATQWMALWLIFGVVSGLIKSTAWTAAVLGVFKGSRGLALGLTLSGAAISQTGVPPLANWLIEQFGWRAAYMWLALGWGGLTFLCCLFFFFDARDRRKRSSKSSNIESAQARLLQEEPLAGLTPRQALVDTALWRVAISNFIVMALTMGLAIHLFPILTDAGVTRSHAAWLLSMAGIVGIMGKLMTGFLLDRFRPNWIGGLTLGTAAAAFLLLMYGVRSPVLIVIAMLVNGYAAGTKTQITAFLTASYGGMRSFGAIYGVMAALMALATGIGPLAAGMTYDLAGSYSLFLLIGAIGCAFGGALMISMPVYPGWKSSSEPA
jgi:predicted MFS family arabinose efflux permease